MGSPLKAFGTFIGASITLALLSTALVPAASARTQVSVAGDTLLVTGGTLERQDTAIIGPLTGGQGFYDVREDAAGGPHEDPGTGCTSVSAVVVHCTASGISRITVDAGTRDDTVLITNGTPATVTAKITGGTGNDILRGGNEVDRFLANVGLDGSDQFYGGGGPDTVDYSQRVGHVSLSLDGNSNDGFPGENDFISGDVENLTGGSGDDTLIGNGAPNTLFGEGGKDDLTGGGGSDKLFGFRGDDVLRDDLDATADQFDCGDGNDTAFIDLKGVLNPKGSACENVAVSAIDQHPNVAIKVGRIVRVDRHRRVHLRLACPRAQRHGCRHGRLTLKRGKRKLGSGRYSLRPGKHTTIVLQLTRRDIGARVQATALERDPRGRPKTTIASFRLQARR